MLTAQLAGHALHAQGPRRHPVPGRRGRASRTASSACWSQLLAGRRAGRRRRPSSWAVSPTTSLAPHDAGYDMPEVLAWLRRTRQGAGHHRPALRPCAHQGHAAHRAEGGHRHRARAWRTSSSTSTTTDAQAAGAAHPPRDRRRAAAPRQAGVFPGRPRRPRARRRWRAARPAGRRCRRPGAASMGRPATSRIRRLHSASASGEASMKQRPAAR